MGNFTLLGYKGMNRSSRPKLMRLVKCFLSFWPSKNINNELKELFILKTNTNEASFKYSEVKH